MAAKRKLSTIDQYLAPLSSDKRAALEKLRRTIKTAVPRAEECISYQIPAFRLDGKVFIWFGAGANHCAIYGVDSNIEELEGYDMSGKGTVRFQPDKPIPVAVIRKLVKARIAKVSAK